MDKKFLILLVLLIVGLLLTYNKKVDASVVAQPGQLSDNGKYANMTPMKHDFFKLTLTTFVIALLFSDKNAPLFDMDNVYDSTLGKGLVCGLVFALYHMFGEPIVNYLPKW